VRLIQRKLFLEVFKHGKGDVASEKTMRASVLLVVVQPTA
jgi:hypothetical protein